MAHLVILVSNTLRRRDFLEVRADQIDVLTAGHRHLTLQKEFPRERDQWSGNLGEAILKRILRLPDWKTSTVRIAAHASTCFGDNPTAKQMNDQRHVEEEKILQQRLGWELDVQVYGFHHEDPPSEIFKVLRDIKKVVDSGNETRWLKFFQDLERAFALQSIAAAEAAPLEESQKIWEELSVIRHQIIGLFDPMRLRLESAREKEPVQAAAIRTSVESSLEAKRDKAQSLLKRAYKLVPGEAPAKYISDLQAHLDDVDPKGFTLWLRSLDDKLNRLRSITTGKQ